VLLLKRYFFASCIIILVPTALLLYSCANIIPPGGGPRDTLPPVLLKAAPADSTLHFTGNKIVLTFNEYVQLGNTLQTDLVVSPNPQQMPLVESKLQTVTVRLKDSLVPNTTYSINFGKTIKDVNEGNPYKNFTYVFATGNTIDNGALNGRVQLAETGTTDSTLIVILHKDLNDSAIKKERPFYYARLDSGGRFNFRYLAYGTYAVYVLPNDFTKRYDDSTKTFAFLNEPVVVDSTGPRNLTLYAYNEFEASQTQSGPSTTQTSTSSKRPPKDTAKSIIYTTTLQRTQQDLLSDLVIKFTKPLASFDSTKLSLNDTNFHPINGYTITADTSFSQFTLKYPWKEEQSFKLLIQKDAFVDSSGLTLAKDDTINFHTASEAEYGSIRLRFSNLDLSRNPVLQFTENNKVLDSAALTSTEFFRRLYKPGEYGLRILYDADKNMTWTPGSFDLKKQPEIVVNVPRKINIKQNWDNEVNINL